MQQPSILSNGGRGPFLYHRLDQICVAVSESLPPDDRERPDAMHARYEKLRTEQLTPRVKDLVRQFPPTREGVMALAPDLAARVGNDQISALAPDMDPKLASHLVDDLTPSAETWVYITEAPDPLESLIPIQDEARVKEWLELRINRPWIVLPTNKGSDEERTGNTKTLYFYGTGAGSLEFGPGAGRLSGPQSEMLARRIRDLANLVNLDSMRGRDRFLSNQDQTIVALPNWLATAVAGGPSPGSKPAWIRDNGDLPGPNQYWRFKFANQDIETIVNAQRGRQNRSDVVIAILDTSPDHGAINARLTDNNTPQEIKDNQLLQEINIAEQNDPAITTAPKIFIDDPADRPPERDLSIPRESFNSLGRITEDWRNEGKPGLSETFAMDDHGLFITGIIHDIAPMAETHLLRAIGGLGVSDIRKVLHVLEQLPVLIEDPNRRLVVNMSLGFSIPPGPQVLQVWLEKTFEGMKKELGNYADLKSALDALERADPDVMKYVRQMVDSLQSGVTEMTTFISTNDRILVVAAAGNDNGWFDDLPAPDPQSTPRPLEPRWPHIPHRPEPRWPAHYDGVLGIAAVGLNNQRAAYSNRGDVKQLGNGVATFGGDAPIARQGDLGGIPSTSPVNAVKGIYLSENLTMGTIFDGSNPYGWVYWSGTSFATPVIAGLAADLWAQRLAEKAANGHTLPSASDVISEITRVLSIPYDDTDRDTLDCPTILAGQEIR